MNKLTRNAIEFFLTVVVFIGAWKLFPGSVTANSLGDCVLAAIVFTIACMIFGIIVFGVFALITAKALTSKLSALTLLPLIIICFGSIPAGVLIATHFTNYAIIGKAAFILFCIVLMLVNIDHKEEKKNNFNGPH